MNCERGGKGGTAHSQQLKENTVFNNMCEDTARAKYLAGVLYYNKK